MRRPRDANCCVGTTARHSFSALYTAILPVTAGISAIRRLGRASRAAPA